MLTVHVPPELENDVKTRWAVTAQCRTEKPARVRDLVRGMGITIESLETHGGMGRIYTLTDPNKIVKIADIRRSWCAFEPQNYALLRRCGIPCAKVYASATRQGYMICVLERLEFTLTAYIRAVNKTAKNAKWIISFVTGLLDMLKQQNLVYCDLSPDNIMFRAVGNGDFTMALIDPQFLVPLDSFRHVMPPRKADAFDTTYVALKIQTLGMMDPAVHKFTETLCAGILGHVPLEKHTMRWLKHEAPVGLFMAYDVLRKKNDTN
jgi:serine/threonine protein kinase